MYSRMLYILLLTYIRYGGADFMTKNADNYGPYIVEWDHFDECRGPKLNNLSRFSTKLTKTDNGSYKGQLNLTFLEQTTFEEFRISVYTIKDKTKTLLWHYIINKPCQHYMLAALIDAKLKVQNCVVKKGEYYIDLNLTNLMMNYIGDSFFYGNYMFKAIATAKKGNIVCLMFDPMFKKKVKKND